VPDAHNKPKKYYKTDTLEFGGYATERKVTRLLNK
jgi:hypothetical protein